MSQHHLFYPEEEHKPRTKRHLQECAREAETSGSAVYGVKGRSILSSHIDVTISGD